MAQRVLAVLGAVAIVLAAIVVRAAIDDGDSGPDGAGDGDGALVVMCDVDAACDHLDGVDVRSEPAAATADRIQDGTLPDGVDAWVTTSAWAEVLSTRAPTAVAEVVPLATSPAVVATLPERADALEAACSAEPLWRCLGSISGRPWSELGGQAGWGPVSVGMTDPDHGIGLTVLAAAAAGYFDRLDFASNDFDDAFQSWLAGLVGDGAERSPVRSMVTAQGSYSAAGSVVASATADAGARPIELLQPSPGVTATVVVVILAGADARPDVAQIRASLVELGWDATSGEPAPTLKPGVMAALHTLWTEVTR